MGSSLEAQIDDRRKRLIALERERAKLVDELLRDVSALARAKMRSRDNREAHAPDLEADPPPLRISRSWVCILKRLSGFRTFNASEVEIAVRALRAEEKNEDKKMRLQRPGSIRSQLTLLTRKGILKRLGGGNYRISDQVKKAIENIGE